MADSFDPQTLDISLSSERVDQQVINKVANLIKLYTDNKADPATQVQSDNKESFDNLLGKNDTNDNNCIEIQQTPQFTKEIQENRGRQQVKKLPSEKVKIMQSLKTIIRKQNIFQEFQESNHEQDRKMEKKLSKKDTKKYTKKSGKDKINAKISTTIKQANNKVEISSIIIAKMKQELQKSSQTKKEMCNQQLQQCKIIIQIVPQPMQQVTRKQGKKIIQKQAKKQTKKYVQIETKKQTKINNSSTQKPKTFLLSKSIIKNQMKEQLQLLKFTIDIVPQKMTSQPKKSIPNERISRQINKLSNKDIRMTPNKKNIGQNYLQKNQSLKKIIKSNVLHQTAMTKANQSKKFTDLPSNDKPIKRTELQRNMKKVIAFPTEIQQKDYINLGEYQLIDILRELRDKKIITCQLVDQFEQKHSMVDIEQFLQKFKTGQLRKFNFQIIKFTLLDHRRLSQLLINVFPEDYKIQRVHSENGDINEFLKGLYELPTKDYFTLYTQIDSISKITWWRKIVDQQKDKINSNRMRRNGEFNKIGGGSKHGLWAQQNGKQRPSDLLGIPRKKVKFL